MASKKEESVAIFRTKYQTLRLLPPEVRQKAMDIFLDHAFGYSEFVVDNLRPEDQPTMAEIIAADMIAQHEYWKNRSSINSEVRTRATKGDESARIITKGDESPRKATNEIQTAPAASQPVQDRESVIVETAYRYLAKGVKGAYSKAEKAYDTNEATGWKKGQTDIVDRVAWLQGYSVESGYSMEDGQIFAEVCREAGIKKQIILDAFCGCFYDPDTIIFRMTNQKAINAFYNEFNGADGNNDKPKVQAMMNKLKSFRKEIRQLDLQVNDKR